LSFSLFDIFSIKSSLKKELKKYSKKSSSKKLSSKKVSSENVSSEKSLENFESSNVYRYPNSSSIYDSYKVKPKVNSDIGPNIVSAKTRKLAADVIPEVQKELRNIGPDSILLLKVLLNLKMTPSERRSLADNKTPKLNKLMDKMKNYSRVVLMAIKYLPLEVLLYIVRGPNEYELVERRYLAYKNSKRLNSSSNSRDPLVSSVNSFVSSAVGPSKYLYDLGEPPSKLNVAVQALNASKSFNKLRPMLGFKKNARLEELVFKQNIKNLLLQLNFAEKLYKLNGNYKMYKKMNNIKKIFYMLASKK
jgi:hypothetical protein